MLQFPAQVPLNQNTKYIIDISFLYASAQEDCFIQLEELIRQSTDD
jgi:hypothetical protein